MRYNNSKSFHIKLIRQKMGWQALKSERMKELFMAGNRFNLLSFSASTSHRLVTRHRDCCLVVRHKRRILRSSHNMMAFWHQTAAAMEGVTRYCN